MNEKKAIGLCLHYHDPVGFEFLVKKFRREAFYHAYLFTGDYEDAADICQESFSKAFKAISQLKYLNKFYPWFYQILRNSSINFLKKNNRIKNRSSEVLENSSSKKNSPEEILESEEENSNIWNILYNLKPEFREILVLKYVEEKNYNELSEILHIPRGTIMSRLYNARQSFKDIYLKRR